MSQRRCLVRGSINVDEFFSLPHIVKPGETISSTAFDRKPGGKGANQAYAVAKAGGAVDLQGCIGTDGKWIKDLLSEGGVGVERLQIVEEEVTGRAIIQSASDGENSIVLHKGANFFVPPTDAAPDVSPYTHLLLQNEIPLPSTLGFLTANPSITSIFNPSPMLLPEELRLFPWSNLSWLIVNEGELETLLDHLSPSPPSLSGDLISDAKERITALSQAEHFSDSVAIICTLGATGILWFDPKKGRQIGHLPAAKVDKVRDTTGAGDCFAGYFAAGLMAAKEGDGIEEVLKGCLTACAICVESSGAMESYPTKEEVASRK